MTDVLPGSPATLAGKLDHLFRTVHPRDKREYTIEDVANGIRARGGPTISATYVWQLRTGLRDNPTKRHFEALADFFGVPPAYFFDDTTTARIDAELALLASLRDAAVRHLALRAFGISPERLKTITELVEIVRQLEGVPEGRNGSQTHTAAAGTTAPPDA